MRALLYSLVRPLLFQLDAEQAHRLTLACLKKMHRAGLSRLLVPRVPLLPRRAMGIEFPNPLGLAAGLDKNGDYIDALASLGFGFIEIGTVTPRPQPGNPRPRLFRLPGSTALINRLGFNNTGVEHLVTQVKQARYRGILGINIGKNKDTPNAQALDDYRHCLERVYPLASYVVVNVSSPNTQGLRDLQRRAALHGLLSGLKSTQKELADRHGHYVPLAVKISPDLDPAALDETAQVLNETQPDGVLATNTTTQRPGINGQKYADQSGGLSGAPLLSLANDTVQQLRQRLDPAIAVIGVGGIVDCAGARAKLARGADLLQIYTGFIYRGPALISTIVRSIAQLPEVEAQ